MTNGASAVTGLEMIDTDVVAGNAYPKIGVKLGYSFGWAGSNGRYSGGAPQLAIRFQLLEEVVPMTIAAAASSDSANTSILPANSLIGLVLGRVTTVIPTAATFNVGDATTAARFASSVAVAATTTFVGMNHWFGNVTTTAAGPTQAANAAVRITPNLTPGAATGRLALQTWSITGIPPTA